MFNSKPSLKTLFPVFIAPLFYTLVDRIGRTNLVTQIVLIVKMVFVFIVSWLFLSVMIKRIPQVNTNISYTILNPNTTLANKDESIHSLYINN